MAISTILCICEKDKKDRDPTKILKEKSYTGNPSKGGLWRLNISGLKSQRILCLNKL